MIGLIFDRGAPFNQGNIQPSYPLAMGYYTVASEFGCSSGYLGVGSLYSWNRAHADKLYGKLSPADQKASHKQAAKWFKHAIELDSCPAAYFYPGFMHHHEITLQKESG